MFPMTNGLAAMSSGFNILSQPILWTATISSILKATLTLLNSHMIVLNFSLKYSFDPIYKKGLLVGKSFPYIELILL